MNADTVSMIIVDDEEIIRSGLSFYFSTSDLGVNVIALFGNGQQAIDFLAQNPVDIVLTDVNMPVKSGLDVAAYIMQHCPGTHTVIISGYQEFKYAQKAIEYGVVSYLLKPVRIDQIQACFLRLIDQIRLERQSRDNQESEKKKLQQVFPLLQKQFLNGLADDELHSDADREREMASLGFGQQATYKPIAIASITILAEEADEGEPADKPGESRRLPTILSFLNQQDQLVFVEKFEPCPRLAFFVCNPLAHPTAKLEAAIEQQVNKAAAAFMEIFDLCLVLDRIETFVSIHDLQRFLIEEKHNSEQHHTKFARSGEAKGSIHASIKQAVQYLQQNYCRDVSLSETAATVHLNAMYFSRLFKQTVGMNYTDYLTQLRMEKAKQLLLSGTGKVFEIGRTVGYDNDKYFIRLFKRYAGLTPDAYRRISSRSGSQPTPDGGNCP